MPWEHRRARRASFRGHGLIDIGSVWVQSQKNDLRQKSEFWGSFWPIWTVDATCPIKKLRRDVLGKSLGGSVTEKRDEPAQNP